MFTFTTPDYLIGGRGCETAFDLCYGCSAAVKQDPASGRWFITMGHPGFNSPANNRDGYASQAKAQAALARYGRPRR